MAYFFFLNFAFFYLTIFYWFCHTSTCICHGCTRVPNPEPPLHHPSPYHPSGSSQCTSPEHPVSCIEPGLAIRFTYDIIRVSMPFFQIIPPSPSPTESKRLFYTSVSLLLSCIHGYITIFLNFPPTSLPYHPSGSSQCTSPKHPVSCIEPGLVIHFTYDNLHVSMPFSHIIPPSPSPTESKRLFYTSVSLLLSCIQGYHYHLSKFHIYALVYCIGVFLSDLLHSV